MVIGALIIGIGLEQKNILINFKKNEKNYCWCVVSTFFVNLWEDMKLLQIILVLISLLLITNCGAPSHKVDINTVKKENKLPEPDFLIPEAQYLTSGQGENWNLKQFLSFRFLALSPFFTSKEANIHKSTVYTALNHMKDFEVISWYSQKRDAGGKVRPIFTYALNSSLCRDYQVLLYIGEKARSKTLTGCKNNYGYWGFNYWDWPGAEKYIN